MAELSRLFDLCVGDDRIATICFHPGREEKKGQWIWRTRNPGFEKIVRPDSPCIAKAAENAAKAAQKKGKEAKEDAGKPKHASHFITAKDHCIEHCILWILQNTTVTADQIEMKPYDAPARQAKAAPKRPKIEVPPEVAAKVAAFAKMVPDPVPSAEPSEEANEDAKEPEAQNQTPKLTIKSNKKNRK